MRRRDSHGICEVSVRALVNKARVQKAAGFQTFGQKCGSVVVTAGCRGNAVPGGLVHADSLPPWDW